VIPLALWILQICRADKQQRAEVVKDKQQSGALSVLSAKSRGEGKQLLKQYQTVGECHETQIKNFPAYLS
jgi:hypothetical protein